MSDEVETSSVEVAWLCCVPMGCKHAKLMPDDDMPPGHDVKTVVDASSLKLKDQQKSGGGGGKSKKQQQQTAAASQQDDSDLKSNRKVSKYQAKFDTRVTAKYDIKALIGKGSFSRVVRVEHRVTRQPYAIKIVDRKPDADVEVCQSELIVLRRVKHPYIIQLVEVFETKDKVYMVMELATGGELFDRIIARGSFTEKDATCVLRMVFDGLRYLHGLGIAHRDLKPENLLYYHPGHDSKILITDFGLSACRKAAAGGGTGADLMNTVCGTNQYIAPELIARRPYTCQVDMWAMGVITFILLSGTMPFDHESLPMLFLLILKAKYSFDDEPWKDVSATAKDFISRLFVVNPAERLTPTTALAHPWLSSQASANKDLHGNVSKNLLVHRSSLKSARSNKSGRSARSARSTRSNRSGRSLRSSGEPRRVVAEDLDALHNDPDLQAELSSLSSSHKDWDNVGQP